MQTAALKKANRINRENRKAGIKVEREQNLMKKAEANPKSLKKAIAAHCFHCFGGTIDEMPDPGWKQFIRTCTAPQCPLYRHRPYIERLIKSKRATGVGDVSKNAKPRQLKLPIVEH